MNRRTFLKSLGVACGTAVVAPVVLLKPPTKFKPNPAQIMWMKGKDGSRIEGINCDMPMQWISYYMEHEHETPIFQTT